MNAFNHIAEWTKNGICRYRLSEKEAKELYRDLPRPQSELDVVQRAQDLAQCLRAALTNQSWNMLQRFKLDPQLDILVIDNWPINNLQMPETPVAEELDIHSFGLTAAIQVGLATIIGQHPLSYPWENSGRLFRQVTGRIASVRALSSHGSLATLPWHADHQTLPIAHAEESRGRTVSPQTLSLFCMRTLVDVPTMFLPIHVIYAQLSNEGSVALERPLFRFQSPESAEGIPTLENAPVLIRRGKEIYVRFGRGVATDDAHGQHALNELRGLLTNEANWVPILLMPGSVVLFKNNKVLHSRSGFQPTFDGADRWFIRLFSAEKQLITPVHPEVPFMGR